MEIVNTISNNYSKKSSLTIGAFDTIHKGHRYLMENIKQNLSEDDDFIVITFSPNPKYILGKNSLYEKKILSINKKREILESLGVDILCELDFNENFSKITAEKFLSDYIISPFSPNKIFIGHDLYFGHNKEGNFDFLKSNEGKYGYNTISVPPVLLNETVISTFSIRNDILGGRMDNVFEKLGFYYEVEGEVKKGKGLGKKISFPTANIDISSNDMLLPRNGVYLVEVHLPDGKNQYGMANIGYRPTVSDADKISLEVHIFNFKKPLYQCKLKVSFISYIRNEIKFDSIDALKNQIVQDEIKCKEMMN